MTVQPLDVVVLTHDVPTHGLRQGDLGTVVEIYGPHSIGVEFVAASGRTQALVTLHPSDLRPVADDDLLGGQRAIGTTTVTPTWIDWAQTLLAKDWFLGFLSGVAATVLGFLLTIGWDVYKIRRDTREKEDTILRALSEELRENKTIVERDAHLLQQELEVLVEQKAIVRPLSVLKVGFWDIAKVNLPKALLRGDRLLKLRNVAALADDCNEQIRSRENYRIHNGAMSNFSQRMRIYDEPLVQGLAELKTAIDEYERVAPDL